MVTCLNTPSDFGNVGAYSIVTDFTLAVTYVPNGNSTTLTTEAADCAGSACPN